MQFHIKDMTCGGCANSVTRAIHSVDPAAKVEADPVTRDVIVNTGVGRDKIVAALSDAGYPPAE